MKGKWTVTPRVGVEVSQEKSDEIASKLNDGRDVEIAARSLSGVFKWSEQPEGVHYWAIADDLVTIEYVTEEIQKYRTQIAELTERAEKAEKRVAELMN